MYVMLAYVPPLALQLREAADAIHRPGQRRTPIRLRADSRGHGPILVRPVGRRRRLLAVHAALVPDGPARQAADRPWRLGVLRTFVGADAPR